MLDPTPSGALLEPPAFLVCLHTQVLWSNFIVCYIVLAFHINGVHNTWALWSTVNFWPNLLIIIGSLVGPYVLPAPRKKEGKAREKSQ